MPDANETTTPVVETPVSSDHASEHALLREAVAKIESNPQSGDLGEVEKAAVTEAPAETKPAKKAKAPKAETPVVEAKPEEPKPETKTDAPKPPPVDKPWAAVHAAEKRLREEAARIKAEKAELEQLKAGMKPAESIDDIIKKGPGAVLKEMEARGLKWKDLVQHVVKGEPEAPKAPEAPKPSTDPILEKLTALEKRLQAKEDAEVEQKVRGSFRSTLADEKYSLLATHPSAEQRMFDYAVEYYNTHGEALPNEEIAEILQESYREELQSTVSHAAVRQVLKELLEKTESASGNGKGAAKAKQELAPKKAPKTLTNNMPSAPIAKDDEESESSTLDDNKLLEAAAKLIPPDAWGD